MPSRYATGERVQYTPKSFALQGEAEANPITRYILDFRDWLSRQFHCSLRAARYGTPTPTELVEAMRPWVDHCVDFLNLHGIPTITTREAIELSTLFNQALDGLEQAHHFTGESSAGVLMALSPLEDILVLLSFRVTHSLKARAWSAG